MADTGDRLAANLAELIRLRDAGTLDEAQFDTARRVLFQRAGAAVPSPLPPPPPPPPPMATAPSLEWHPSDEPEKHSLRPVGALEIALSVLLVLMTLLLAFRLLVGLADTVVVTEGVRPETMLPAPLPAGFQVDASQGGARNPQELADAIGLRPELDPEDVFEGGYEQHWQRADGARGLYVVLIHTDESWAMRYLETVENEMKDRGGSTRGPSADDAASIISAPGGELTEAVLVRGAVAIHTFVGASAVDQPLAFGAANAALAKLRTAPCYARGSCRAWVYGGLLLGSLPIGALALGLEGARRRRFGIGRPIAVPGLVGIISRARIAKRSRHRNADVVLGPDSMVIARAPWGGAESLIGLLVAGFFGYYAGERAMGRRDAGRRNKVARVPLATLAAQHASNRVVPYASVTDGHVLATGRSGWAKLGLADGSRLRFQWSSAYNRFIDAPALLQQVLGPRLTVKRRRFSPILVLGMVLLAVFVILAIVAALVA